MNQRLNKTGKISIITLSLLLFAILISIICYDQFFFKGYRNNLEDYLKMSEAINEDTVRSLREITYCDIGKRRVRSSLIQWTLGSQLKKKYGMIKWHVNYFLSNLLLGFFFSEDEIFTLWCNHARYEKGIGLKNAAVYYFNREIGELKLEELIKIAIITRSPDRYGKNPELLEFESIKLLNKLKAQEQIQE